MVVWGTFKKTLTGNIYSKNSTHYNYINIQSDMSHTVNMRGKHLGLDVWLSVHVSYFCVYHFATVLVSQSQGFIFDLCDFLSSMFVSHS